MTNATYQPRAVDIKRGWHLIDAKGKILGRMASDIARLLMGKHKKTYSAHLDSGDFVVVINSKSVEVTGRKEKQKKYYSHSGYPGGFKEITLENLRKKSPNKVVEKAIFNMLPKNRLRQDRMNRLKVFAGAEHKYSDKLNVTSNTKA